jgi:putative phage-type endonuclease
MRVSLWLSHQRIEFVIKRKYEQHPRSPAARTAPIRATAVAETTGAAEMTAEIIPFTTEADWLKHRLADVTSTESAALFGMSPYVTRYELWHRKKSGMTPVFESNERMEAGNFLEPGIAAWHAHCNGWQIRPMKDYRRLPAERIGASFDFEILNHPDGPAHLEIKNVDFSVYKEVWLEHEDGTLEAPPHIELQIQHQMLVSGYPRAFIGALVAGNRRALIERLRDEPVIAAIRHRIKEFWQSVDAGIEPDPIMPEDAAAVIRLNQYAEPGKILDATADENITALVMKLAAANTAKKLAEEDAEVTKAELLIAIGDAEKVLLAGFSVSAGTVQDSEPTLITADHIGTTYGGRKGFRNCRLYPRKASK